MQAIPINLDKETINKLDILVKQGIYKNRTEAIRDQIQKGLAQIETVSFPMKTPKYDKLLRKMLNESPPDIFSSEKSAVDIVAEGRER